MREIPMLFADAMVRAMLSGTKTQTRRPIKPQPEPWCDTFGKSMSPDWLIPSGVFIRDEAGALGRGPLSVRMNGMSIKGPCQSGDVIWVRECWFSPEYEMSGKAASPSCVEYRADNNPTRWDGPWRPSIHMPRWACRLFLRVVSVRAERVWDISDDDLVAEGFPNRLTGKLEFMTLWSKLYGEGKDWCWANTFERIDNYGRQP